MDNGQTWGYVNAGFDPRVIVRWSARLSGALVFRFWGAFFVERMKWFYGSLLIPPARVWLLHGRHRASRG